MAQFDPFERAFRDRAQGLRRHPDERTWDRLDRRLRARRRPVTRVLRPWMIAALFVLAAGLTFVAQSVTRSENPLAQRSEFIQELSTPYQPAERFEPVEYWGGGGDPSPNGEDDFRDVPINEKFRS